MPYLLAFIFYCGLLIAAVFARKNALKWPANLMFISSLLSFIAYIFIILISNNISHSYEGPSIVLGLTIFCCTILYFIGLFFYCLKTYAATKANQQLDYLNFQLKDQLEIRSKS